MTVKKNFSRPVCMCVCVCVCVCGRVGARVRVRARALSLEPHAVNPDLPDTLIYS